MSEVNVAFEGALIGRVEALKELYTEFFLFMDINLDERPELEAEPAPTAGLDKTISSIMDEIQKRMDELRVFLGEGKSWRVQCGPQTLAVVDDFQEKLTAGLEAVLGRVEVRGNELQKAKDETQVALTELLGKKKSRAAYQGVGNAPSALFDSNA